MWHFVDTPRRMLPLCCGKPHIRLGGKSYLKLPKNPGIYYV